MALAEIHALPAERLSHRHELGVTTAAVMKERLAADRDDRSGPAPPTRGTERRFDPLARVTPEIQRVHGDFHLGQTLHTPAAGRSSTSRASRRRRWPTGGPGQCLA